MDDFDSVYLVPKGPSMVSSRAEVDLRSKLYGLYPIMSSPMKGISGYKLVCEMGKNNCLGILHRFETFSNRIGMIKEVAKDGIPFGVAIGFGQTLDEFKEFEVKVAKEAVEQGAIMIVVDVANGYIPQHKERGNILRDLFPNTHLMSGNVITKTGAEYLSECGFNFIRVGIGGGSVCITRDVTGVGRNQLEAIKDCSSVDVNIVSDGGINLSGKAVKSFALGADFVMLGGMLAESIEAEHDGIIFGMASHRNHLESKKVIKSIEGMDRIVEKKKPLKDILENFLWGIRSACTYLSAKNYDELRYNALVLNRDE